MNIDSITLSDHYDMPLRHPATDEPLTMSDGAAMWIRVASNDSTEFKQLQSRYRNETLRNPNKKLTAEKEDARMTEFLVVCTKDWLIEGKNGKVKFTPDAARELYTDPKKPWIRNQVTVAVFNDVNFLGESKAA